MKLKDYVLSYTRNGEVVANLFDYYERFVKPLDDSFKPYSYYSDKLVLCYFKEHADVVPSMGYIKHRYLKGVTVCHCLGCGRTADVVRLHQIMMQQYKNRELTEEEACREIASIYDIPIEDDVLDEEDYEKAYLRKLRRLDVLSKRYTEREFSQALLRIREKGVDLDRVNSECVKLIATHKKLYD